MSVKGGKPGLALNLWLFWIYSFFGYLLEKGYAAATRSEREVRKGFLLLPLCPVYGLGVLAVLALPPSLTEDFFSLALWGGLTATAVEYAVHWGYDVLLGVQFWDYSGVWGNLHGRVCVPFTLAWGLLLAVFLPLIQPPLSAVLAAIPVPLTYAALLVFASDAVFSLQLLRLYHNPELLSLRNLKKAV